MLQSILGENSNDSLKKRCEISNQNNCDFFISVHCNAGGGTGTETYIYKKGSKAENLATTIQKQIIKNIGTANRGVKENNYYVLKYTNCPACLVETAFIDNAEDSLLLKDRQADFAQAIANGILEYLKIEPINPKEPSISEIKDFITKKWNISDSKQVFDILDKHAYSKDLYVKIYDSYK